MGQILVKVVPGASRDELLGRHGPGVRARVKAPPEAGRANAAVCRLIASRCGVPESSVRVIRGASSPRKTIEILSLTDAQLLAILAKAPVSD